jgi:DNA-binding LytR/AlgR family response regulator
MKAIQVWLGHSNYAITANLYSHLEYNAKVISAETIARVLDSEAEQQSEAADETTEPEKKSTKTKSASKKTTAKTTDTPAPKKSGERKKKSDTPAVTGESQTSRL